MKNKKFLMAAAVLAAALSPAALQAANNTWTGAAGTAQDPLGAVTSGFWDYATANWASPTLWASGDNAIFGGSSGWTIIGDNSASTIGVGNLTFNSGWKFSDASFAGTSGTLMLTNATTTITVAAGMTFTNQVSLNGSTALTFAGTGTTYLSADAADPTQGNKYKGGTYIQSGTVVMAVGGNESARGAAATPGTYAIDQLTGLDASATLILGTTNDTLDTANSNYRPYNPQVLNNDRALKFNLTGGTFIERGDNNAFTGPSFSGTGTIVNDSPYARSVYKVANAANGVTTWAGCISDGGATIARANSGPGYQMNVDINGSMPAGAVLYITGSNHMSGFLRLSGANDTVKMGPGSVLFYCPSIGTNPRQLLMNSGTWDLNGTSQQVGTVYTGNDSNSKITNSANGTVSTLIMGVNVTNLLSYNTTNNNPATYANPGKYPQMIRSALLDDPSTGGTLAITKEGIGIQSMGNFSGDGTPLPSNYHGDTTINNGTLEVLSTGVVSPNSAFRLNTTQATLRLLYSGNANVKQLFLNGVQQPNGVYGSGNVSAISGSGTITVTASTIPPADNVWAGGGFYQWDHVGSFWSTPAVWVDGQNAIFDATGAASSPVTVAEAISARNLTFNTAGYTINGLGGTLSISNTVTANQNAIIAVELTGANGLVKQGSGTLSIAADTYLSAGNNYTGGTYVRAGTLILSNSYANTSGTSYAVDSIEALDAGATVVIGTTTTDGGVTFSNVRGQIGGENSAAHLHMTGGTLDVNNDNKNQRIPVPDGTGLIVNNGSLQQSGLQIIPDGLDHTWSGVIADGNNGVLNGLNNTGAGKGPGYQIGIVQASGTGNWTWTGANTYSGSTRLDGGIVLKLSGAGTLGRPTLTNGMTGPMRWYTCSVDLNGTTQTISLMTAGNGSSSKVYNSAVGTTSTLVFGYGMEQAFNRNANYYFTDNLGTGGKLSLKKINTQPYMNNANNPPYLATNCLQQLSGPCDYSGDTIVDGGWLWLNSTASVSSNSAYRLATTNQALLKLAYSGDAPVRQLWINGVQQPNGTYGASTAGIDPASTGTITVTGSTLVVNPVLGVTKSGNALTFTWTGSFTLQAQTNTTSQGLGTNWVNTPYTSGQSINIDSSKGAVFFRLKQ